MDVARCYAPEKARKMKIRCNPRFIKKIHSKSHSWRLAAKKLNAYFGVDLPHLTWRDYATGRRDIVDPKTREALGLDPRPCPKCGMKPGMDINRLIKRLTADDLEHWGKLRRARKYRAAHLFLEEVYRRKIKQRKGGGV